MENTKMPNRIIGTVVTVLIVLALVVMCIIFGNFSLTDNQFETMNILLIVCLCSIAYCFIVGEITQNFSQMDKLWSILPIAYAWIIAANGGMKIRLVIYALIVTVWGIRLTINFARKGAYSLKFWTGTEDYRWSIVHGNKLFSKRIAWTAFDLFFISMYQNLLVLAICFPALACMESDMPLGIWDVIAAFLAIMFLTLETVADEYQWKYHQTKKKLMETGASDGDASDGDIASGIPALYALGFNTTGPWSRMRHPNYLGEQGIWMSLYVFTLGAGVTVMGIFNWSMIGPLLLILLFMGSSTLGESISSKKYPMYRDYAEYVYKYIPIHSFKNRD